MFLNRSRYSRFCKECITIGTHNICSFFLLLPNDLGKVTQMVGEVMRSRGADIWRGGGEVENVRGSGKDEEGERRKRKNMG